MPQAAENKEIRWKPLFFCMALCVALISLPIPNGLSAQAWTLFSIFITIIVGFIFKPMPMGSMAILGLAACTLSKTISIQEALSSFSSKTVWLIVISFFLARGFIKTGLGSRIAYYFVYFFGKSTLGLAYSFQFTELLLAPLVPSNTARGAGIIFPIVNSLCEELESSPKTNTENKFGSFLILVCFQANVMTSSMFLTAMAANPLIASLAARFEVHLTWTLWAKAALIPGFLSLITVPLLIYRLNPPEVVKTPGARDFAKKKLKELGPLKKNEKNMLVGFILILNLWIFGDVLGIDATSVAFFGLSFLLVSGVLTWNDIISEKNGWNTFIWLTILLMMTSHLAEFGMIQWFSTKVHHMVAGDSWKVAIVILALIYFYSHYLFTSMTAHITSMFTAFAGIAILSGTPPLLATLLFAFCSNLCSG